MNWDKLQTVTQAQFQRYTGIKLGVFEAMIKVVKEHEQNNRNNRSRPYRFGVEDRILILLCYYREYPTFFHLGIKYGINESTAFRTITYLENLLIKSGVFTIPKKSSIKSDIQIEAIVVDASESPIQRPQDTKQQKRNYSGKKNSIL
jgi:hypothetical protein